MKKCLLFLFLFSAFTTLQAQYKKASFLNKKGRTYDLGGLTRILGGGNSSSIGFYFSWGKETTEKRLFHWFDLDFVSGSNIQYTTTSDIYTGSSTVEIPVAVTAKSGSTMGYRYNLAFYLLDNGNEANKFLPYIDLSIGTVLSAGSTTNRVTSPSSTGYLKKELLPYSSALTFGGGLGAIYNIKKSFGIKLNVNYSVILTSSEKSKSTEYLEYFTTLPNHPTISLGVHWLLERDND
jgi:hypothetical protein